MGTYEMRNLQAKRFAFLHRLYELSNANQTELVHLSDILLEVPLEEKDAMGIALYLKDKNLLEIATSGPQMLITTWGIDAVERAIAEPRKAFPPFAPVINVLHVDHMDRSQIQQGTLESHQTQVISDGVTTDLKEIVASISGHLPGARLVSEDAAQARADVATLEAQLSSPKPRRDVLCGCLKSLKAIAKTAAASAAAKAIVDLTSQGLSLL